MSSPVNEESFTSSLVPVEQTDAGPARRLPPSQLPGRRFVHLPEGWELLGASAQTFSIAFVDLEDPENSNLPPVPALLAGDSVGSLRLAARVAIDAIYASFARGSELLELELADLYEPHARIWANWILEQGKDAREPFALQAIPLGRGYAAGQSFVVDAEDQLIRGSYDDGAGGPSLSDAARTARRGRLQDRALELMRTLSR